jgi:hypothetical protein
LDRPLRQEAYAHWFPEEATFQPTLIANYKRNQGGASSTQQMVDRLYSSYEKVGEQGGWGMWGFGGFGGLRVGGLGGRGGPARLFSLARSPAGALGCVRTRADQ